MLEDSIETSANTYQTTWCYSPEHINTLWTGDADLRLYITTVQGG